MSCSTAIKVKRGGSLSLIHSIKLNGVVQDLTDWEIAALIKFGTREVASFTITPLDLAQGIVQLQVDTTEEWPIGTLVFDVKYTLPSGYVYYSPTLSIACAERITP